MKAMFAGLTLFASVPVLAQESQPPAVAEKRSVFTFHPLATAGGLLLGAAFGGTFLVLPVEYEYAVSPSVSLTGQLAPMLLAGSGGAGAGFAIYGGVRYYVSGAAPKGWWVGGSVGALSISSTVGRTGGFDVNALAGYQWVTDSGFAVGVNAGLAFVTMATGGFPLVFSVPIGVAF